MVAADCGFEADSSVTLRRECTTLGGALEVALLDEEWFVHLLKRLGLLADGDCDRAHTNGTATVIFGHDAQHAFVHLIETRGVDFQ